MYNRFIKYITKQKILSNFQFGLRKGNSTEMAILMLIDIIENSNW